MAYLTRRVELLGRFSLEYELWLMRGRASKDALNKHSPLLCLVKRKFVHLCCLAPFNNPGCVPDAEGLFINSVGASETLLKWFNRSFKHHQHIRYTSPAQRNIVRNRNRMWVTLSLGLGRTNVAIQQLALFYNSGWIWKEENVTV